MSRRGQALSGYPRQQHTNLRGHDDIMQARRLLQELAAEGKAQSKQ
jgi:hypothetical protein